MDKRPIRPAEPAPPRNYDVRLAFTLNTDQENAPAEQHLHWRGLVRAISRSNAIDQAIQWLIQQFGVRPDLRKPWPRSLKDDTDTICDEVDAGDWFCEQRYAIAPLRKRRNPSQLECKAAFAPRNAAIVAKRSAGATIAQLSQEYGITDKRIRVIIARYRCSEIHAGRPDPLAKPPSLARSNLSSAKGKTQANNGLRKGARNAFILTKWQEGTSMTQIAKEHGITRQRVQAIITCQRNRSYTKYT